jgi:hypothetical protein
LLIFPFLARKGKKTLLKTRFRSAADSGQYFSSSESDVVPPPNPPPSPEEDDELLETYSKVQKKKFEFFSFKAEIIWEVFFTISSFFCFLMHFLVFFLDFKHSVNFWQFSNGFSVSLV